MRRKHSIQASGTILCHTVPLRVRFSEVDSMRVVWHGEYVRYFEDGREAFGEHYAGLSYPDIQASGYTLPVVELHVDYKLPLHIAERATVEARYIPTEAAKICFQYTVRRSSDNAEVATGSSTQVFLNEAGELELMIPEFFKKWQQRWNVR